MTSRRLGPLGVAEYAEQVRRALADVPTAQVLADLDEHLAEVAADGAGSLEAKLGPPAVYAQQLRQAAHLSAPGQAGGTAQPGDTAQVSGEPRRDGSGRRNGRARVDVAARLAQLRADLVRLNRHDAVREVVAFLPELRPAWWVLRGWMAVVVLGVLAGYGFVVLPFGVVSLLLIPAAAVLSVRLGRRAQRRPPRDPRQQLAVVGGNALLGLIAFILLIAVQQRAGSVYADGQSTYYNVGSASSDGTLARADGSPITNIYPYSATGEPLTGVLLYDQDGRALDNLGTSRSDGTSVQRILPSDAPPPPANAFPQQQQVVDPADGGPSAPAPVPVWTPPPSNPRTASAPAGSATATPATTPPAPPAATPTARPTATVTPPGAPRPATPRPTRTPSPAGTAR